MEGENFYDVTNLSALPEDCICNILSFTSPKEACILSLICPSFSSAVRSDVLWQGFLPTDYDSIISRSSASSSLMSLSKRDLYFHLCDTPILIDKERISFSLEKHSGKKCYVIGPKALSIVWGDTPEYWAWMSLPESRFPKVPALLDVCWLEISGLINSYILSPKTNYEFFFVFKWNKRPRGFSAHNPLVFMMRKIETDTIESLCNLNISSNDAGGVCRRADGWSEIKFGELFSKDGDGEHLEMKVSETSGGNWKSGLVVEGFEIRPKKAS